MDLALLKTKLGAARPVALERTGGGAPLIAFASTGTGRPLTAEEAAAPRSVPFRGVFLATEGTFRGRTPFHAVYGAVGGAGRIVVYDRWGQAARWSAGKPKVRRRGLRFDGEKDAFLQEMFRLPEGVLGFPGAYLCPACGKDPVQPSRPAPYLTIPLCARCASRGPGPRDWVGFWTCPQCGDRVKEETLACPFCETLARERG